MGLNRYFIRLAFNGTAYHGWQIQKNAGSVQQTLTNALTLLVHESMQLTGAGRTDTGVHAWDYYAHFDLENPLDREARNALVFKLNGFLQEDIVINDILPVIPTANARFSALSRTYRYVISTCKNPFLTGYAYYLYGKLNLELMNEGAAILLETKDFTSFSKVNTDTKTNICTVFYARWDKEGDELVFTIKANRFLRNMVRAIVGTLLELGRDRITLDDFRQIIASKSRSDAGGSVPACGLFLANIEYPDEIFL
jgi:tRNA pseudouridine38-40 synthase